MAGIWGAKANQIAFKLRPNAAWDGTEIGSENSLYIEDGIEKSCYIGEPNIIVDNCVEGTSYTIIFAVRNSNVWVKIAETSAE